MCLATKGHSTAGLRQRSSCQAVTLSLQSKPGAQVHAKFEKLCDGKGFGV